MRIGIIGYGMVGGALGRWLEKNTNHTLAIVDPYKNYDQSLENIEAAFICIPVRPSPGGQDLTELEKVIENVKKYTTNIFVRSTVLPGTCDRFGVSAAPEFLTSRRADEDMDKLPILVGPSSLELLTKIFPGKEIVKVSNKEAEMAKFAHNCAGAVKVTYWNIIYELCKIHGADFNNVKQGAMLTGFIEKEHTMVPGPDGKRGYGGACFPDNVAAFKSFSCMELNFFQMIEDLNTVFRD